jgi:hypothetical protein
MPSVRRDTAVVSDYESQLNGQSMTKHDQAWIVKAAETAVSGAAGGADALISGAAGAAGSVLTKSGLALAPGVAGAIAKLGIWAYSRHLSAKIDQWMDLVATYMDLGSVEAAAVEITESIDEEWAHAAVVEGVRAILNDINIEALPFLARVTAYYLGGKRPIDRRGKRLCDLLSVCDADVLNAFRGIVAFCKGVRADRPIVELHMLMDRGEGEIRTLHLAAVDRRKKREEQEIGRIDASAAFYEALHLMKEHQLARDGNSGFIGSTAGPGVAIIDQGALDFIAPFLI